MQCGVRDPAFVTAPGASPAALPAAASASADSPERRPFLRDGLRTSRWRALSCAPTPFALPSASARRRRGGFTSAEHGIGVGDNKAMGVWWESRPVADLRLTVPVTVTPATTCAQAVEILTASGFDQLPVVGDDSACLGVVTEGNLTAKLLQGRVKASDSVVNAAYSQYARARPTTTLGELARLFDRDHFAVIVQTQRTYTGGAAMGFTEKSIVVGVVSRIDLLK